MNYSEYIDNLAINYEETKNIKKPIARLGCTDVVELEYGPGFRSANQHLAGSKVNKNTLIPPIICPPSHDLTYWHQNNLINHSHINVDSQQDTYLSGYESFTNNDCNMIEEYTSPLPKCTQIVAPTPVVNNQRIFNNILKNEDNTTNISDIFYNIKNQHELREHYTNINKIPTQKHVLHGKNEYKRFKKNSNTNINSSQPELNDDLNEDNVTSVKEIAGFVNTKCGYNQNQSSQYNTPNNLQLGQCEMSDTMKEYNKDIFTQNIQPDIFSYNEIIEPINSNIGISFTQQFEPLSCQMEENGDIMYVRNDPYTYKKPIVQNQMDITESNVYDPRFYGYGTSYRAYTDENLGQTRFYYDDIQSVRMPNYLVRSNIDFTNYADSYGPLSDKNQCGNINNERIREMAQDTFLNSSLQQRTSLSESLMRKRNAELWQTRMFPKRTFGGKC